MQPTHRAATKPEAAKHALATKIRVLIADDHPIVREGLKQILSAESDFIVAGEATNAAEVLSLVQRGHWDVVVLDLSMPGRGGLEALKDLKSQYPTLPVLILSVHPEDQFGVRVLTAGASGYLTKDTAPAELVKAIRKAVAGKRYVSPTLAEQLAVDLERRTDKPPHERLSDREYLVMTMMASGKTVSDIAKELSLSVNAISTYRGRIFEKLKLRNSLELVRYALEKKLVT